MEASGKIVKAEFLIFEEHCKKRFYKGVSLLQRELAHKILGKGNPCLKILSSYRSIQVCRQVQGHSFLLIYLKSLDTIHSRILWTRRKQSI